MRPLTGICLILFSLLFSSKSVSEENITIALLNNYPPYMHGKLSAPKGIYIDILKEVFQEMETEVTLVSMPWKRVIHNIEHNKTGAGGLYITKERMKKYDFSKPIFEERLAVYVKAGSPLKITKLEDLKGLKVGTVSGWSYTGKLKEAIKNKLFVDERAISEESNIRKLAAGRIDATIAIIESAVHNAKKLKLIDQIRKETVLLTADAYIAFNKKARKTKLLNKFNDALYRITLKGKIDNIMKRYNRRR